MTVDVHVSLKCEIHRERYIGGYRYSAKCPMFGIEANGDNKESAQNNLKDSVESGITDYGFAPPSMDENGFKVNKVYVATEVSVGLVPSYPSPEGEDEKNVYWMDTVIHCVPETHPLLS